MLRPSGYYRINKDHTSDYHRERGFIKDNLVYCHSTEDKVEITLGNSIWTYHAQDLDDFDDTFTFEPDGNKIQKDLIHKLMNEIEEESNSFDFTQRQLEKIQPETQDGLLTGNTLAVAKTKTNITQLRNQVLKIEKSLNEKNTQLKSLLEQQTSILHKKLKKFGELVSKAEEAIWSINLYLGKNEDIKVLRIGHKANPNDPINIHQLVKFMDEECALEGRTGGITINTIEQFDEWLLKKPENLDRVLPDSKGIVVFHIKRIDDAQYDNPWVEAAYKKANLNDTYFLIRNGECLYRVFIDLVVGSHLFPDQDEYISYFKKINYTDEGAEETFLKPGTKEYMEAMKSAQDQQRHYLRVVLVLQGLLDRTKIFNPMPVERINLCDLNSCHELVNLRYEQKLVLTDGRPVFVEWQESINEKIAVGHRIIGLFDYRSGIRGGQYQDSRIWPTNAKAPSNAELHTIEEQDGDKYIFRYKRNEDIFKKDSWGYTRYEPATNRARCWVAKDDNFILNFDVATVEELNYYLNHRQSRKDYRDMIPILEAAIELKTKEVAEEEPFRKLLIGQIASIYKISYEDAEESVNELVPWWKFKNRTHRALLSDDVTAMSMILKEHGLRKEQAKIREQQQKAWASITDAICDGQPNVVAIYHQRDNRYVAYLSANEQNIWLHEQIWILEKRKNSMRLEETKEWKLLDKRNLRWELLYSTESWKDWRTDVNPKTTLSDPELARLESLLLENLHRLNKGNRVLPLCLYHDEEFNVVFWYSTDPPVIPALLISEPVVENKFYKLTIRWVREKGLVELPKYLGSADQYIDVTKSIPWRQETWYGKKLNCRIIHEWHDNLDLAIQEHKTYEEATKKERELKNQFYYVNNIFSDILNQKEIAKVKAQFDEDYGDDDLWEDYLKKNQPPKVSFDISRFLNLYAERGLNPVGLTVLQVIDQAKEWGEFEDEDKWSSWNRRMSYDECLKKYPLNFVIPPKPIIEE